MSGRQRGLKRVQYGVHRCVPNSDNLSIGVRIVLRWARCRNKLRAMAGRRRNGGAVRHPQPQTSSFLRRVPSREMRKLMLDIATIQQCRRHQARYEEYGTNGRC